MTYAQALAALFERDLTRLTQQVEAFADEADLWRKPPGVTNSAGHLALHLDGNLREFIGRQLGGVAYRRNRPDEFQGPPRPRHEILAQLRRTLHLVPSTVAALSPELLAAPFPECVLGREISTQQFVVHLYGHLSYHLGQIDYVRRVITSGQALQLAQL